MTWTLIGFYIERLFIINLLALGVGLIAKRMGHMRVAKALSIVSLAGISVTIAFVVIALVLGLLDIRLSEMW